MGRGIFKSGFRLQASGFRIRANPQELDCVLTSDKSDKSDKSDWSDWSDWSDIDKVS